MRQINGIVRPARQRSRVKPTGAANAGTEAPSRLRVSEPPAGTPPAGTGVRSIHRTAGYGPVCPVVWEGGAVRLPLSRFITTSRRRARAPTLNAQAYRYIPHALSSRRVTITETRMEPTIPSPFEKKKNIRHLGWDNEGRLCAFRPDVCGGRRVSRFRSSLDGAESSARHTHHQCGAYAGRLRALGKIRGDLPNSCSTRHP